MANLSYDKKIKEWILKNKDEIIEKWIGISEIPAIKGEAEKDAPFGVPCLDALRACADMFGKADFESGLYSDNKYALAKYGSGEKTIGIFSHSDVVPANEEDWIYTKPFEPKVIEGCLIGRGVEDNKSGIMAALCAMRIIRECDIPLKSKLVTFIGSEEETGMSDIEAFVAEQPMPDVSVVPDADFPCSVGEKGIFHFWAECGENLVDIVDFNGGEAFNIVLDKVTVRLKVSETLKREFAEKLKDKDGFSLEESDNLLILTAKGVAKHACEPEGSINAAYIAAELLSGIESLSEADRKAMEDAKKILTCPFGTSMGIAHDDIRFGKLTFVNGMTKVCDGKLMLSFDTRYGSTLGGDELENRVDAAFDDLGWTVKKETHSVGFSIDDESPIPAVMETVYEGVTGLKKTAIRLGGGTYARKLENAFSVGTFTECENRERRFWEMPAGHGGAHQADEKIDIEGFFEAVRIITQYIINIDEIIN